jgi:WD40 repeat protein
MLTAICLLSIAQTTTKITGTKTVVGINPVAFAAAPKGSQFVASLETSVLRVINAADRMSVRTLIGHPQPAMAVAWSPNGKLIASGDESGRVFFWDVATGKRIKEIRTHTKGVHSLSFNAAGTIVLSTGKDDTLRFYAVPTGKQLKVVLGKGANLYGAKYMPGNNNVILGTLDGGGTWLMSAYVRTRTLNAAPNDKGVWDVDVFGGRAISAQREGTAVLWDIKKGTKIQTLKGHMDWVTSARFSPNGKLVATSSTDQTVRVWDTVRYQMIAKLDEQTPIGSPLCFTTDGKFLITVANDNSMQIHSITSAKK